MIRLVGYSYSPPTSYLPRVGVRVAAVSRIAHLLATALRCVVRIPYGRKAGLCYPSWGHTGTVVVLRGQYH